MDWALMGITGIVSLLAGLIVATMWNRQQVASLEQRVSFLLQRLAERSGSIKCEPAVWWQCPMCDAVNYDRCVLVEVTDQDRADGMGDVETGDVWADPDEVQCTACGAGFWFHKDSDDEDD